jgi:hypothetical protein
VHKKLFYHFSVYIKSGTRSRIGYTKSSFVKYGAKKTMKSHNVQPFQNSSDQVEGAGEEASHIGTVQH